MGTPDAGAGTSARLSCVRPGGLVGIDVGSTRIKAVVVDLAVREAGGSARGVRLWHLVSSGAEAEPDDIYQAALAATRSAPQPGA